MPDELDGLFDDNDEDRITFTDAVRCTAYEWATLVRCGFDWAGQPLSDDSRRMLRTCEHILLRLLSQDTAGTFKGGVK